MLADRVKETSTTTGTGNLTLAGAVTQFIAFSSAYAAGETFFYAIVGQTGSEWEIGVGQLSGGALVRSQVLQSSNAGALVSLSAGTKDVFVTVPGFLLNRSAGIDSLAMYKFSPQGSF